MRPRLGSNMRPPLGSTRAAHAAGRGAGSAASAQRRTPPGGRRFGAASLTPDRRPPFKFGAVGVVSRAPGCPASVSGPDGVGPGAGGGRRDHVPSESNRGGARWFDPPASARLGKFPAPAATAVGGCGCWCGCMRLRAPGGMGAVGRCGQIGGRAKLNSMDYRGGGSGDGVGTVGGAPVQGIAESHRMIYSVVQFQSIVSSPRRCVHGRVYSRL
jgi:hypothetical protein